MINHTATVHTQVDQTNTALAVGSGNLEVFATPMMIALMERAACEAIAGSLAAGQSSVGTQVNVSHVAASPVGARVSATATVTHVTGRQVEFEVVAHCGEQEIGRGTHTRFLIDAERFMAKVSA